MKKRLTYVALAMVLMLTFSSVAPAAALAVKSPPMQSDAVVLVSGGIKNLSGTYYIWGQVTGASEEKTITATLYQVNGSKDTYYDSTSKTDTTSVVETSKPVKIASGYMYKLVCVGTSPNSTTPSTYYYDFR